MKKEINLNQAKWLVEPGCVVLVTAGTSDNANMMTFSWQTPVNTSDPCQILLAVNPTRYTYELIKQNHELVINVPGESLLEETHFVGTVSGKNLDKFAKSGLTPVPAKLVGPPLIDECVGHLECRLSETFNLGHHDLLVCNVLRAVADVTHFDGKWMPETFHTLHYLGGITYGVMERRVTAKGKIRK
jgi:flavin reductase (DIM6/NTAB) family NADH-FMN oxidoreductase RutF